MPDTDFWIAPAKRPRAARPCFSAQPGQFTPTHISALASAAPSAYASGGQGLLSTAGDYLRFARMLMNDGELEGVRVLKRETAQLLRTNRYSDAERKHPFVMGQPFTQGFGLGVSVVTDVSQPGAAGGLGTFGWPGAFGGWWQADPQADLVLLWLQQCAPAPPQPGARMPRIPGMQAIGQFREAVYKSIRS
jgi:CubicO group peptidase (beta-lactamase class C family)